MLTPRQSRFVEEYLVDLNGKQAATDLARELTAARQDLKAAERVYADCTALLAQAEQAESRACTEIAAAAEAVIVGRGLGIADRLAGLEREALRLMGLDRVWVSLAPGSRLHAL